MAVESRPLIHPSRQANFGHEDSTRQPQKHSSRRRPTLAAVGHDDEKTGPVRNAVRSLTRLLQHNSSLPADVRVQKERELQNYRLELANAEERIKRRDMISKYHMVRFFDRKTAAKNVKRCRKGLEAVNAQECDPDKQEALKDALHDAEVDYNYTIYFPLEEKYWSLFPKNGSEKKGSEKKAQREGLSGGDDPAPPSGRKSDMWYLIEDAMAKGTLEEIRDRKLAKKQIKRKHLDGDSGSAIGHVQLGKNTVAREKRRRKKLSDMGGWSSINSKQVSKPKGNSDQSDDGFFEK